MTETWQQINRGDLTNDLEECFWGNTEILDCLDSAQESMEEEEIDGANTYSSLEEVCGKEEQRVFPKMSL